MRQHHAPVGVPGVAGAGVDHFGAGGQAQLDVHLVGGRRAGVTYANKVRRHGAGEILVRAAPVDVELRLAADDRLNGFDSQIARGERGRLHLQIAGFTGGQLQLDRLRGAGRQGADAVPHRRLRIAARRDQLDHHLIGVARAGVAQRQRVTLRLAE
jgi:hypothetical protein